MKMKFFFIFLIFISACNNATEKKYEEQSTDYNSQTSFDIKSLAKRANSFYEQEDFQKAVISYDSLILVDSTKAGYFFKRGYCKSMLLDKAAAIPDYKKSIELNYSGKQTAYQNIGELYQLVLRKYDSAIYYYNECLKIEPHNETAIKGKEESIKRLIKLKTLYTKPL